MVRVRVGGNTLLICSVPVLRELRCVTPGPNTPAGQPRHGLKPVRKWRGAIKAPRTATARDTKLVAEVIGGPIMIVTRAILAAQQAVLDRLDARLTAGDYSDFSSMREEIDAAQEEMDRLSILYRHGQEEAEAAPPVADPRPVDLRPALISETATSLRLGEHVDFYVLQEAAGLAYEVLEGLHPAPWVTDEATILAEADAVLVIRRGWAELSQLH